MDAIEAVKYYNPAAVLVCWEPYGSLVCTEIANKMKIPIMVIGAAQGGCTGDEELFEDIDYIELEDHNLCLGRTDYGFNRPVDDCMRGTHSTRISLFNWNEEWLIGEEDKDWYRVKGYAGYHWDNEDDD